MSRKISTDLIFAQVSGVPIVGATIEKFMKQYYLEAGVYCR